MTTAGAKGTSGHPGRARIDGTRVLQNGVPNVAPEFPGKGAGVGVIPEHLTARGF